MQRACSTLTHYCGSSTRWQLPGDAGKYRTIAVEIGPAHTPSLTSPSRPSSEQRGAARRVSARTANGSKPAKGCSARSRGRFRRRTDAAAKNPDAKIETLLPEGLPRRGCRSERSAQAYAEGGSRSRVPSNGEGPETPDRQSGCANVGTEALAFRVEAFSFREPGPTSLENARGSPKTIGASMQPAAVPCQFHLLGRKRAEAGPSGSPDPSSQEALLRAEIEPVQKPPQSRRYICM
jgi:hypothetical protein